MWQGRRVSVVFPAYNEEAGIAAAVLVGAGPTRRPPGRRDRRAGGDPPARSSSGAPQVPMRTAPPNGRNGNGSGNGARDRRGRSREH